MSRASPLTLSLVSSLQLVMTTLPIDVFAWSMAAAHDVDAGADGTLVPLGRVTAAGECRRNNTSLSCLRPPGSALRTSSLGMHGTSELRVLSLPSLALVHTHTLEGMQTSGSGSRPLGCSPRRVR